ncbi:hypothetical protein OG285_31570 [Streptomyces sp. NBC_01471]|uniref:hypothetical protein n=1 Tax=Streptomyces sp. NBC_01471 TaxID=2903879 RepID=UPI0032517D13
MNDIVQLDDRPGLICDAHGDARFLRDTVVMLASRGRTSLVQLRDFGMNWHGTRNEIQVVEALNEQLSLLGVLSHEFGARTAITALQNSQAEPPRR